MAAAPLALALAAALSLLAVRPLAAQAPEDLQRIGQRLSALGPLEPLPDSPRNRDAGDIAIIEHDGSSYDRRLPDGSTNYEARARVGLRFYETHADEYDFLVVFTNFEFDTGTALAFHTVARNDVQGIGKPVGSVEAAPFGSRSRLKGWIDMSALSRYESPPYALAPGGPDFLRTLGVLAHELGHQWLAEARYKVGDAVFDDLLGADDTHWSYLLDSDGSFLYGADWRSSGDGSWAAASVRERYSPLDLYLMGMLPKDKVPPLTLLRNPAVDRRRVNLEDETVEAAETTTVTIEQVIAALGPRVPDSLHAQKEYRVGFVFLAAPGTEPSPEDLDGVERVRRAFGPHFFSLTNGVGWVDTRLAPAPESPRAEAPDLDRALAWLAARQGLDGSWADSPETRVRDTAAAVLALSRARHAPLPRQRGASFLRAAEPESLDFQARVAAALDPGLLPVAERQAQAARILGAQNPDGGWGAAADFSTDALDTALALRALSALERPLDARIVRAVEALGRLAGPDGGWAAVSGGDPSTVVTAEVLLALHDWSAAPGAAALRAQGLAALLARRNADFGFGSSPSTPHASALALEVLLRAGAAAELVDPLSEWLQQAQLSDGSWASSSYQTALVLQALAQSLGANLVVPADSVALSANPAREGEPVRVVARVRNAGRAAAPATVARLFDADPTSAPALAEAPVPALAPGAEAEVALDYSTVDRPGRRTLYVVADAGAAVRESREDDNTASASLSVLGLLADLVLRSEDVVVDPAAPAVSESATIVATVRNAGERAAGPFTVSAKVSGPSGTERALPPAQVASLAIGEALAVALTWTPVEAGPHVIVVTADAGYQVPESDETNGVATRPARVSAAVPDGAELAVLQARATPAALEELPQALQVSALLVNAGRTAATTAVALVDDRTGERLGETVVELNPRAETSVVVRGTLASPGGRRLWVVVDPASEVPEEDETDNELAIGLPDAGTIDVELAAAALSAAEVERGESVLVTIELRNRGTTGIASVPVQLAHDVPGGPVELARTNIALPAGEARTLTLSWRALVLGDAVPLLVRADPFDLLVERREDNNAAPLSLRVGSSPLANLAVSGADVTFEPAVPVEGDAAAISAIVRNTGAQEAGPFLVRFVVGDPDLGGRTIGEVAVDALAPGASRPVTLAWPRVDVRGELGLFVIADAAATVREFDESDNRAFRPFSALGLPDLVLAAGDVALDPAYPREGDSVTIRAVVRNLGGLPAAASSLEATEIDGASRAALGRLAVPPLAPGAFVALSLDWLPAAPAGERRLSLVLDPDSEVAEQDEGNNEVERAVVVQDADLFLSEPYFSPDGDGVKDETTVAWRASAAPVRVVVSNARGEAVRLLVEAGAESGSATWDGRDTRGVVAWDGSYTISVVGPGGARLGTARVALDTNRSPIHDAVPGRTVVRNLTCGLPDYLQGPVFTPAEDEVLYIVPDARPGFPVGLLRASPGGHAYVAQDEWYRFAAFASAVSPDGREVLVYRTFGAGAGQVLRVDLATGERRPFAALHGAATWSPDGRFLLDGRALLARDGTLVADLSALGPDSWHWAPGSDRLAGAGSPDDADAELGRVVVASRDGTLLDSIPLPRLPGEPADQVGPQRVIWRGDGRLVANVTRCVDLGGEAPECSIVSFVVDPEARIASRLAYDANDAVWSPEGGRLLFPDGELRLERGTSLGLLLPAGSTVSPQANVATYWKATGDTSRPGSVCGGKSFDTFLVSSAANLAVELEVARLVGNGGVVVRGTVADANLERFELDYASAAEPGTWHPIGAALDVPVLDDVLTIWVPPAPGAYLLRLRASDRAGHAVTRTRAVAWDRVPALANFTQSDYYLSPEQNDVKDRVTFRYTVLVPTRVDVRVVGPEPASPDAPAPSEVWQATFEHSEFGPQSFSWDGRDAERHVVPDGRYTVEINGLPFRIEVDNTPPEIGMRFQSLGVGDALVDLQEEFLPGGLWPGRPHPFLTLSSVSVERAWHVVDERLRAWRLRDGDRLQDDGKAPVFVADSAAAGGLPRVRREDGRPLDVVETELVFGAPLGDDLRLDAWDLAGNHSEITVARAAEAIFPLGAVDRERREILHDQLKASGSPSGPVNALRPERVVIQAGSTLSSSDPRLRLAFDRAGGPERELPLEPLAGPGHANLIVDSFEALGIDPTRTYRGRFEGDGEAGEVSSPPFLFCPCEQWARAVPLEAEGRRYVMAQLHVGVAVERVEAKLFIVRLPDVEEEVGTIRLQAMDAAQLEALFGITGALFPGDVVYVAELPELPVNCANRLRVKVSVYDAVGKLAPTSRFERACQQLLYTLPAECRFAIDVTQEFPGCSGSPDLVQVRASGFADQPARVVIEGGPPGNRSTLDAFDFVPTPENKNVFERRYEASVENLSGEIYPVVARITPLDIALGDGAADELEAVVDRSPPAVEILLPPEGGSVCLADQDAKPPLDLLVRFDDAAPFVTPQASWRRDGGPWALLPRLCPGGACDPKDPGFVPLRRPVGLAWNAATLEAGELEIRVEACDRSGNRGSATRRLLVRRDPPAMQVMGAQPRVFSPNGDGRSEQTLVTLRLAQAANLSAEVHALDASGPLVRTLIAEEPHSATDVALSWDGRAIDGRAVADGDYAVVFTLTDACGGASRTSTPVTVDTTSPTVAISQPSSGQRVSATLDVLGQAQDAHLAQWELDLSCNASPDWTRLATKSYAVAPDSFLARWDTSSVPTGACVLRLAAEDRAGNRSPEAFATAVVERGAFLDALSATPDVFSPNGDGRRETATVGYRLARQARVFLQLRDGQARVVKALETGAERAAGAWSHVWDGGNDAGGAAPDGVHTVWIRVEDPAAPAVFEERSLRLDLDRSPPLLAVVRPAVDGFAAPSAMVRGRAADRNFAEVVLSATPVGSAPVELGRVVHSSDVERDLVPLSPLAEGPHVLQLLASDVAENQATLAVPFSIDATPPRAAIQSPLAGAILRRGEAPHAVSGLVLDAHLASWTLRFGAGADPSVFGAIAEGTTGGSAMALGAWDVRFLPDGPYTLSLVATDRGGLTSESRVTVVLDGQPPVVAFSWPTGEGYVTAPSPVFGTASDPHLRRWELEWAPGNTASAYQWSPLAAGVAGVTDGRLGEWSPLPADGVYALRLTAEDEVGLSASTKITLTVDTTPPAPPRGLEARITPGAPGYGRVALGWLPNTEPDLAGYFARRLPEEWTDERLAASARDDGERVEGRYSYEVVAVDHAGNRSAPAVLSVLVDLTPPLVSLSAPLEDASLSGAVEVRGTAWSADDFAEYRLLVGAGEAPTEWTLLRRSSAAIAAGRLGDWLALVDGSYSIALEAEDTSGNRAHVTRRVVVDTVPPAPPVLIEVARPGLPPDTLVPTWDPSPSSDVVGTLVYRGGRLANTSSIVVGDRRGLALPGTSYADAGLPDGEHCYRVVAIDAAANESGPSNEICRSLDNRVPRAIVTHPPDGSRFGHPVRVVAETPDLDVATIRFERRAAGASPWVAFGELRPVPPWETTLDPEPPGGDPLEPGAYELRAVATDHGGNTDPDPARISVVYGDTTAPSAPTGLVARVDGRDVSLTWDAAAAADFASWRLYRDGERIAEGLLDPRHLDGGLELGSYEYTVTALDADGNESPPSSPAQALAYAIGLEQPVWPVYSTASAALSGSGSRPATTVKVVREGTPVAETPGTGGAFRVEDVPLVPDANVLQARGEDALANRSVVSNEVVLIANAPPLAVSGLAAVADGATVRLDWAAVADVDRVGYVVRRDGERLTPVVAITDASVSATTRDWQAGAARDSNPATAWTPEPPGTGALTLSFSAPVLLERVRLRFGSLESGNPGIPASYTLFVRFLDRELPVLRVRGNAARSVEHVLPAPFLTAALTIALESPGGLVEVEADRLDPLPADADRFDDGTVADGRHAYAVGAIDRYGAESTPAEVEAAVGDVEPPAAPLALVATPLGRDVQLSWNASPEPDVAGYVVLRDGARIASVPAPGHVDPGRPNGTYRYTVIAVDAAGHESPPSNPADATIDVAAVPPPAPEILDPTDAAHPITLAASRTDVGGRAPAGATVSLDVDGAPSGVALAGPGFRALPESSLGAASEAALSPDGTHAAWTAGDAVWVRELASGSTRSFHHGGAWAIAPRFSPDGTTLAFVRHTLSGPLPHEIVLLALADGSMRALPSDSVVAYDWSPDGARLAVALEARGDGVLQLVDVASLDALELERGLGVDRQVRFSPDGARLALVRSWWDVAYELRVLELASLRSRVLDPDPWPWRAPSWSADGRLLAWTSGAPGERSVRVQDVAAAAPSAVGEPAAEVLDPRFSPAGDWLSFVRLVRLDDGTTLRSVDALHTASGLRVPVRQLAPSDEAPEGHEWVGGRLAIRVFDRLFLHAPEPGWFVVRDVALAPGENRLVARATDAASRLVGPDSETVRVTTPAEAFADLAVSDELLLVSPRLPIAGHAAELRVRVDNHGDAGAGEAALRVRVTGPGGALALDTVATLPALAAGEWATLLVAWTPPLAATYELAVEVDADGRIAESSEANNAASRSVVVVAAEGLAARIAADRPSYPAHATAAIDVTVANAGAAFAGEARTTVEDDTGAELALVDARPVSLEWGRSASYALAWNVGATWAGRYRFVVRVRPEGVAAPAAAAEREFDVTPAAAVLARVRPQPTAVAEGAPVAFALLVQNQGTNAPLAGAVARLRVQPEGAAGPAVFETVRALEALAPGGVFEAVDTWSAARPPGRHAVRLDVELAGATLATAQAFVTVQPLAPLLQGALAVAPRDVLAGASAEARVTLRNLRASAVPGYPVVVEVVSGPLGSVLASAPVLVDLAGGETRTLAVMIETAAIPPGRHGVRLRGGSPLATLDSDRLVVHGAIVPPSPHAPAEAARVATSHPTLVVNDAVSPEGAALRYEFELFGDAALTQPLPGARDVAQAPPRTPWTVAARLAEDTRYFWRARARDGFSASAWSAVASFTVDELDLPPSAPVPDTPPPGARVASRQPPLGVRNALDPEGEPLAYEFRLARDQAMADVVAAQAGLAEGLGFTTWLPPLALDEDATYYWSARARTPGDGPQAFSPWSEPVSFLVDTVNESPTPPRPLSPTGGAHVATLRPELVVENATDPEGDALVYRFELDSRPSLDSPGRQASGEVLEGTGETAWTPEHGLAENTTYYWRAFAGDGGTETASILATFFVNAANEPPTAPVPLDPVDGRTVGEATPRLCARNSVDPEGDPLSYVFEVRDAGGAVVWSSDAVASGPAETCAVSAPLAENASFTWSARASDGELFSPWSPPAAFRVDALAEAPTAPEPLAPADGAALDERPTLVVRNATSPDELLLSYTFELERLADDGTPTLVERAEGVVETPDTTAWTPGADLDDGSYQWRARASDPRLDGPWSVTFRFTLTRDRAPAAPTGLAARAGDARVSLTWNTSPEPDVAAYGVYRSETPGGPYAPVAVVPAPAHEDAGLVNGVTYYYVVTARDARADSGYSNEAAARPSAPAAIVAEAMFDPPRIPAECLLAGRDHDHDDDGEDDDDGHDRDGDRDDRKDGHDRYRGKRDYSRHKRGAGDSKRDNDRRQGSCRPPDGCPEWLYAAIEPPAGVPAASIEPGSLRLLGALRPDRGYAAITDVDHDGWAELRVRFALEDVARHLVIGVQTLTIVGRAGASALTATGRLEVLPVSATLRMEPRTLQKRSHGEDVLAKVSFAAGVEAGDVDVASIRLNGVVRVERVLSGSGRELKLKFDRAAVVAVLPTGSSVEVRLSGLLRGLPFLGIDHIRVIQ